VVQKCLSLQIEIQASRFRTSPIGQFLRSRGSALKSASFLSTTASTWLSYPMLRNTLVKSSILLSAAYIHHKHNPRALLYADSCATPRKMGGIPAFQTTFAVPMHCNSCVEDVTSAIKKLDGIFLNITPMAITADSPPRSIVGRSFPSLPNLEYNRHSPSFLSPSCHSIYEPRCNPPRQRLLKQRCRLNPRIPFRSLSRKSSPRTGAPGTSIA
jgi:hypothetical protein